MASKTMPAQPDVPLQSAGLGLDALLMHIALAQATDLARAGRYLQAESILSEWSRSQEPVPAALDLLARIRAQQGRLAEAEVLWTQALQLDPGNEVYSAGLRRIGALRRRPLVRFPWSKTAQLVAIGLLIAGAGLLTKQMDRLEQAVSRASERTVALELRIDQVAQAPPVLQPRPEPDLAGPVRQALQADQALGSLELTIRQVGSAVSLSGTVPSLELRQRAETLARQVAGVALVDGSGLIVAPPPLAAAVRQALRADARTAALAISVEQVGHSVRLEGVAPSLEAKVAVEAVARGVPGVELADATDVRVEPPSIEYFVRQGDTLASIASRFYGDAALWRLIYAANQEQLSDANAIQPGQRLRIPLSEDNPPR